jgi:hypothetical protein
VMRVWVSLAQSKIVIFSWLYIFGSAWLRWYLGV